MILTFATENYKEYLNLLLSSYGHFNPSRGATIYCVGWSGGNLKKFKNLYKKYDFRILDVDDITKKKIKKGKRSGGLLKYKPKLILDLYLEKSKPFLWIDADSMVLGGIEKLLSELMSKNYEFMCTHRPSHKKLHAKFAVAVLGFNRTDKGKDFLKAYVKETNACAGVKGWFQEQLGIYNAFINTAPNNRVRSLAEREHSIRRNKNSLIISRRINFEYDIMSKAARKVGVKIL